MRCRKSSGGSSSKGFNLHSVVSAMQAAGSKEQQEDEPAQQEWLARSQHRQQQQPQQQRLQQGSQQQQQQEQWEAHKQQQQQLAQCRHQQEPAYGEGAADGLHDGEVGLQLVHDKHSHDGSTVQPSSSRSSDNPRHHDAAAGQHCRLQAAVTAAGTSLSRARVKAAAQVTAAQNRIRTDLGLGPKWIGSKGAGSAAAAAGRHSTLGRSQQQKPVSRIGPVPKAVNMAAAAAASTTTGLNGRAASGGDGVVGVAPCVSEPASAGAASGFMAAFKNVLQRADINKLDERLLEAASDQKHAAAFAKLLDQYDQKDQLAQQLEGITKLQVQHGHLTYFACAVHSIA
eukprot:GHRR01023865.1.p1 GENE.GHRR01023865.1~~GHRR01023865.1.p1  ORF type:complete len:342 (+),score=177.61 GHRR01023865.1:2182-3207(+)